MNGNGYNGRTPGSLGDSFERFEVVSTTTTVGRKVGVCCCDEHVYSFVIRDLVLNKQWNVGPKTTQDFHQLHYRLSNLQASGDLPNDVPVPALPSNGVVDVPCTEGTAQLGLASHCEEFGAFLAQILAREDFAGHPITEAFIEVSMSSFNEELGPKMREGWAYITSNAGCLNRCLDSVAGSGVYEVCSCAAGTACCIFTGPCGAACGASSASKERWFVIKPSYIAYYEHPEDPEPNGVLLFGRDSKVETVYACCCFPTAWRRIHGSGRSLKMRAAHPALTQAWEADISLAISQAPVCQAPSPDVPSDTSFMGGFQDRRASRSRTEDMEGEEVSLSFSNGDQEPAPDTGARTIETSFAARHDGITAKWFVDGWQFYEAAAVALEAAQHEILIADWMFSPEVILKRPSCGEEFIGVADKEASVMNILKRKCEQGVQVHVMIYSEIPGTVPVDSAHAEAVLHRVHPNLHTMRHPGMEHMAGTMLMWSHHEKLVVVDQTIAFCGGIDLAFGRCDHKDHRLNDVQSASFLGKDYYNPNLGGFQDLAHPDDDDPELDRHQHPRMPWHDIHMAVKGRPALDIARHYAGRWNRHLLEGFLGNGEQSSKQNVNMKPILLLAQQPQEPEGAWNPAWANNEHVCSVQVLRSVSWWSAGVEETERSCQDAYVELISNAEHCIYIENQFFISSTGNPDENSVIVQNTIVDVLAQKIASRIIADKGGPPSFRCYVVLPNYPEGNLEEVPVQVVLHWEQQTIYRAHNSLYAQLRVAAREVLGADATEEACDSLIRTYITFSCLRQVGALDFHPVCEQVYVHSKMLIVDDQHVVIGSANINDRSQLGHRDSEICCLVQPDHSEDASWVDITMNGQPYRAGAFAHSLRTFCMGEHSGVPQDSPDIQDPIIHSTWSQWLTTAQENTALIAGVWPSQPRDEIQTLAQWRALKALEEKEVLAHVRRPVENADGEQPAPLRAHPKAWKDLSKLRGHLVNFPLKFLSNEALNVTGGNYEFIAKVFT